MLLLLMLLLAQQSESLIPDLLGVAPIYEKEDQTFRITFDPGSNSKFEQFVFALSDRWSTRQKTAFNVRATPATRDIIRGPFFSLSYRTVSPGTIAVVLRFETVFDSLRLEVYHLSTDDEARAARLVSQTRSFPSAKLASRDLMVKYHWRLTLNQTPDSNWSGFYGDEMRPVTIKCEAHDGYPDAPVQVLGLEPLRVLSLASDPVEGTQTARVLARLSQSDLQVGCRADHDTIYEPLRVTCPASVLNAGVPYAIAGGVVAILAAACLVGFVLYRRRRSQWSPQAGALEPITARLLPAPSQVDEPKDFLLAFKTQPIEYV